MDNSTIQDDRLPPGNTTSEPPPVDLPTEATSEETEIAVINTFIAICLANAIYLTAITVFHAAVRPEGKKFARICNLISAVASTLLCINVLMMFVHAVFAGSRFECYVMYVLNIIIGTVTRMLIYTALWARQSAINGKNAEQIREKQREKCLSNFVLVGIVMSSIIQIVTLSLIPNDTPDGGGACEGGVAGPLVKRLAPVVFSSWILFQILLLLLTLLPLVRYLRAPPELKRSSKKIKRVIIRLCVCALTCAICDGIFLIVIRTVGSTRYFHFVPLCYSYNISINLYATIFSFINYKQRLWPFAGQWKRSSSEIFTTNDNL